MIKKLAITLVSAVALLGIGTAPSVSAQTGDCDNNAIVRCGAFSVSELQGKMTGDIPAIYAHYGITSSNLNGTVVGSVRER